MTNWVEIAAARLEANYKTLCAVAGVEVLAVIKADAYGHGAALCAPVLARAGASWLGVTDAAEGAAVRAALTAAGIALVQQPRILVMSGLVREDAAAIVEHMLTPVVWTVEQMEWLTAALRASEDKTPLAVHLEIDSGMSRQGSSIGAELDAALGWLAEHRELTLECVMTHFAAAEITGSHQTDAQQQCFEQALAQVAASGLKPAIVSAGNTSAIDNSASADTSLLAWLKRISHGAQAMVRAGLGLYGYCLPIAREPGFTGQAAHAVRSRLAPVMTWKARVIGVREIAPGAEVGYNGIYIAQRAMRLALLPAGYADGLRRELSSTDGTHGWVMLHGNRAPIVGRVSMNLSVVDVSEIPGVAVGDEAIVLGEGITADDHAQLAGTIPYEILCGVRAEQLLVRSDKF